VSLKDVSQMAEESGYQQVPVWRND